MATRRPRRAGARGCGFGEALEGEDDERVAGENSEGLTKGAMDGRLATAAVSASSKQGRSSWTREAQCRSSMAAAAAIGDGRGIVAAGGGNGEAKPGADAGAAREHGVAHGGPRGGAASRACQLRRWHRPRAFSMRDSGSMPAPPEWHGCKACLSVKTVSLH